MYGLNTYKLPLIIHFSFFLQFFFNSTGSAFYFKAKKKTTYRINVKPLNFKLLDDPIKNSLKDYPYAFQRIKWVIKSLYRLKINGLFL